MSSESVFPFANDKIRCETLVLVVHEKSENRPLTVEEIICAFREELAETLPGFTIEERWTPSEMISTISPVQADYTRVPCLPFLFPESEELLRQDPTLMSKFGFPPNFSANHFLLWRDDVMALSYTLFTIVQEARDVMLHVPGFVQPSDEENLRKSFSALLRAIGRGGVRSREALLKAIEGWSMCNTNVHCSPKELVTTLLKAHDGALATLEQFIRDPYLERPKCRQHFDQILQHLSHLHLGGDEHTRLSIRKSLEQMIQNLRLDVSLVSDRNRTPTSSPEQRAAALPPSEEREPVYIGQVEFVPLIASLDDGANSGSSPLDKSEDPLPHVEGANERSAPKVNQRSTPDNGDVLPDDNHVEDPAPSQHVAAADAEEERPPLEPSNLAKRMEESCRVSEKSDGDQAEEDHDQEEEDKEEDVVEEHTAKNKKKASSAKKKQKKKQKKVPKRDRVTRAGAGEEKDDVPKESERAKRVRARQARQEVSPDVRNDVQEDEEQESNLGKNDAQEQQNPHKRDRTAVDVVPPLALSTATSTTPSTAGASPEHPLDVDEREQAPVSGSLELVKEGAASKKQKKKQKSGLSYEEDFLPRMEKVKQSSVACASLAEEKDLLTVKVPILEKQDGAKLVSDHAKLAMVYNVAAGGKRSAKETLSFLVVWWAVCERAFMIADIFEYLSTNGGNVEAEWKKLPDVIGGKKKIAYHSAFPYKALGEFLRKYPRFLFQTEMTKMAHWQMTYKMGDENQNTIRVLEQMLKDHVEESNFWAVAPGVTIAFAPAETAVAVAPISNL